MLAAGALAPLLASGTRLVPQGRGRTGTLDAFIREEMVAGEVPGLGIVVIRDGDIVFSNGYGWADVRFGRRAGPETVFMLASISKTVMATAAMQAVEADLLRLDDDVNDVLPFPVRNPSHPDAPITLRMLLTHTSSIRDNWDVITPFYVHGDSSIPLGDYLHRYLSGPSDIYRPRGNYDRWPPGTKYQYCNIGAALAGYLVEAASGTPFDQWCDRRIFAPLGMSDTGWHLADVARPTVAMPYRYRDGLFRPYGQYGYPDYPDGELRTSARHLANHLRSFVDFGEFGGHRVLSEASVKEMRREQFPGIVPGQGLIWYGLTINGQRLMGHNGGDSGVATQMFFRVADGAGVIVLANGNWRRSGGRWPLQRIMARLFHDMASF